MVGDNQRGLRAARALRLTLAAARLTVAARVLIATNAVERFAEQLAEVEQQEMDEHLYCHPDLMDFDAEVDHWFGAS